MINRPDLPPTRTAIGNYMMCQEVGELLYVSGHGSFLGPVQTHRGKLGADLSVEEGKMAAHNTILSALATVEEYLGDLNRVTGVVRVFGMVNCTPDFEETPAVMDGASDLLVHVFGDAGRHTRCAVGMTTLPNHMSIEIEMVMTFK